MGVSVRQIKKLFRHHLSGKLSDKDVEILKDAVATGEADSAFDETFSETWNSFNEQADNPVALARKEKVFKAITSKVVQQEEAPVVQIAPKYGWLKSLAAVAVISGVVLLTAFWILNHNRNDGLLGGRVPANFKKFTNKTPKPGSVSLADGSVVLLNPGSSLYYPEVFGNNERLVLLEGDAFFEVQPDKLKPFVVESHELRTHVLGTSFWVKQKDKTEPASVIVRTGKVMVSAVASLSTTADFSPITLLPNHQVKYFDKSGQFELALADSLLPILHGDDEKGVIGQAENMKLDYDKPTPLYKIVEDLKQLYGVEIKIENAAMKACLLTGDLSIQELHKKMEIICISLGATYTTVGTTLVIHGKGCGL